MGEAPDPRVQVAPVPVPVGKSESDPVLVLRDAGLTSVVEDFYQRLDMVLESGPKEIVVDMSALGPVSSTTVAALLHVRHRCSARGVAVLLRHPSRRSLDTLGRVGLLKGLSVEGHPSPPSRAPVSSGPEVPR